MLIFLFPLNRITSRSLKRRTSATCHQINARSESSSELMTSLSNSTKRQQRGQSLSSGIKSHIFKQLFSEADLCTFVINILLSGQYFSEYQKIIYMLLELFILLSVIYMYTSLLYKLLSSLVHQNSVFIQINRFVFIMW